MTEAMKLDIAAESVQAELLNAMVVRNANLIASDMGEEKVLLSVENGKYYNLGVMGGQIWGHLQEPIRMSELIDRLLEEYDVERQACLEQLIPFIVHLSEERLLQILL